MTKRASHIDANHPDHFTPAAISKHEHRCMLDRLAKHDRELTAIRKLLLGVIQLQPLAIEARELRASGHTFGSISARTGLTRNIVADIIGQDGAA
ncbi:hypothetical protein PPL19_03105 [Pseudomonas psychrotolerans L19]|uniref:hypothetical protein n=1 Tax=Pseudomonas oryzihabitans TaxID=47885 RepID=UPI00023A38F2|nr:hypothetical protein [Pseudomonas psychrotolerans]EHK73196.1 hypothetical protein PPL19_03105 [Pseudomonas psychrotolerans L19]MBA1180689.1 hypothetical protein [Pseudomonas psychrotolerans]MBA1214175.1 hypothetical protein [Pseudomonas psychrotolerans]